MNRSTKLSRKLQRRLGAKVEREARTADKALRDRGVVMVATEELEALHGMQRFFIGMVKEQGRVRVSTATLDSLQRGDSVKRSDTPDGVMLTFNAGAQPEQGTT